MQMVCINKNAKAALLFVALFGIIFALLLPPGISSALSGSQFTAGNIIDDGVFFDSSTMSSSDVQNFLNSKVPVCDTNGTQNYDSTQTRAQYGATNGNPAPFICLKDYRQDTPSMAAESGLCSSFNGGNRSAAQIIHDIGTACGVNPQVLLVLLQKEQSLVTDDWPFANQYTSATGFGCPDTAPCNPSYNGFFYQVYYAARAFIKYRRDANQYSYFAHSNNTIGYSPAPSCGNSSVYLQNQATTGLYVYTPYQPNQAALDNLYGTGDGCSSYGNRNFWRLFNDWFGSTHAAPFAWQPISQEAYTDPSRTLPANTTALSPNTTYYFRLRVQNMGNSTWHNSGGSSNNQVNLGTVNPNNRSSLFADSSWLSPSRPASLIESTVSPGDYGTYEFSVHTPAFYTNNMEYLNLVAEGNTWLTDRGLYWPIDVIPPTPEWSMLSQQAYYDSSMSSSVADTSTLAPNTRYYLQIQVRNTGNTTWTNSGSNPVRLGTSSPQDRSSPFYDSSWLSPNRPATLTEASVAPGQTGTFSFAVHSPSSYGNYKEYFRPLVEGSAWMNDLGMYYALGVKPPTYQWNVTQQSLYTDSSRSTKFAGSAVPNNTRFYASIQVRNTGNTTWTNSGSNPVRLGTGSPQDRSSPFYDSSWLSPNRPATLTEASVAPGQTGTFSFWMNSPFATNGTSYKEYFRPVAEGVAWFPDLGMYYPLTMQSGSALSWSVQAQQVYSDSGLATQVNSMGLDKGSVYYVYLKIRNLSGQTWNSSNVHLGTSNPTDRTSVFAYNWLSTNRAAALRESSVNPGGYGTFVFTIKTPTTSFSTQEYFRPVEEGVDWFPDLGLYYPLASP